jgi:hypothetical protein
MKGFRIQLNGGDTATVGLSDRDVVSVFTGSAVRDRKYQSPDEPPIDLRLHVGGLRRTVDGIQGSVEWLERQLKVGDEVTIRVLDVDQGDISPPTRERTISEVTENGEREQLAYLIRKYGLPS